MTNTWDARVNEILEMCAKAETKPDNIRSAMIDRIDEKITKLHSDIANHNTMDGPHIGHSDALRRAIHSLMLLESEHDRENCENCKTLASMPTIADDGSDQID